MHFIRTLGAHVLHVHSGRLTTYAGYYDYYLDKSNAGDAREALTAGFTSARPEQVAPAAPAESNPKSAIETPKSPTLTANQIRKIRTEVGELEKRVSELESTQDELTAQLENPETYQSGQAQHLNRELSAVVDQLAAATKAWESAATKLSEAEG